MLTALKGEQQNAIFVFLSQKNLIDRKRLYQRPPEASMPQVRDNDSKCTVKILIKNAFQKGRNRTNSGNTYKLWSQGRACPKKINPARTRSCSKCKVGGALACSIALTIAIQRHMVEGVGPKETLDLPPSHL